jgi:hypothetical protein
MLMANGIVPRPIHQPRVTHVKQEGEIGRAEEIRELEASTTYMGYACKLMAPPQARLEALRSGTTNPSLGGPSRTRNVKMEPTHNNGINFSQREVIDLT